MSLTEFTAKISEFDWQKWAIIAGIFVGSMIVFRILKAIGLSRLNKLAGKTKTDWDDFAIEILQKNWLHFSLVTSIYIVIAFAEFDKDFELIASKVLVILFIFLAIKILQNVITFWFQKKYLNQEGVDVGKKSTVKNLVLFVKIIVWALGVLLVLDNLGFDVTTAIAGLGIGGIAIAMAAQAILSDFFSYFTISFDKPFEVGDFVVLNDLSGTVEHVGIKTTRIRSLQGELIVVGNTDLTGSRLKNFKRMQTRRIVLALGVTYETPLEKLKAIPGILKNIIEPKEHVTFGRAHFKGYGDFSLNFEIVYTVLSADYNVYMDVQQEINLEIFEAFGNEGIDFAYPTQMLYVSQQQAS